MGIVWTDEWMVYLMGAQLLFLLGAALVAYQQLAEARNARREQSRPFVGIDFETERHNVYLVISNEGKTIARDVRFQIAPDLHSTIDEEFAEKEILANGIPTLAPGKKIRFLYDVFFRRDGEEWPDRHDAIVTYDSYDRKESYSEHIVLDLGIYKSIGWIERRDMHDLVEQLKKTTKVMEKWSKGSGGLIVMTPEISREENERQMRAYEERRKDREKAERESAEHAEDRAETIDADTEALS